MARMYIRLIASALILLDAFATSAPGEPPVPGERKLNNLVAELLEVPSIPNPGKTFPFNRASDGWIFISLTCKGEGRIRVVLDPESRAATVLAHAAGSGPR